MRSQIRESSKHKECFKILADTGRVDWNVINYYSNTPLCQAIRSGSIEIAKIIVKQPNIDYNCEG